MEQPLIVQAEYSFKGGNNDELCFKKGDLITVTQREEGGWWEGTLNEKTGWFPSNYVNEYKAPLPVSEIIRPPEEIQEYRSVVLKDLLDSERAHVAEIQGLLENFLEPLQSQTQILTADEYAQLMCNFVEIVTTHDELLSNIEDCNDRVGKLFLTKAPTIKLVHQAYCAAHPRAIVILDKYKDELEKYMERQGAASPGLLVLTTGLSKPFRRLDKYSAMLQELERHMESSHPDRGDTQRSVAVYKDIAATCSATRRQKELELQVLTGPVRGWQGQELSSLGDIIHMGSVAVGPDHRDRYFVLFPQTLLILSVSQRMSAFIYEGKLPLTGIVVNRLEDSETFKNAFEISGPLIERIVAVCQGPNEANKWVELLTSSNLTMPIGIKRQLSNSSMGGGLPQPPAHMSPPANLGAMSHPNTRSTPPIIHQQSQHKRSLSFNHHLSYNQYHTTQHPPHHLHQPQQQSQQNHLAAQGHKSNLVQTSNSISKMVNMGTASMAASQQGPNGRTASTKANYWSTTNLRPAAPLRPNLLNQSTSGSGGGSLNALSSYCSSRKNQPNFEEDALVLRVIEAYCAAYQNNARNTIHSEIRTVSGEPNYKSVNLTWEVEFVPSTAANNSDKETTLSMPPKAFQIFFCEIQSFGPHRCRSKVVDNSEVEELQHNKEKTNEPVQQFTARIDNLRMATKYSFHIRPQQKRRNLKITGRSEIFDNEIETDVGFNGQTIIIPTKGFTAQATKCLPHASEIEVETGPYFGGKIVVDGGNCGIKGNPKDIVDKYVMRIDHKKCGSLVKKETNTVETFITVQENLGIFTHSTRRFVVVCSFQSGMQTVRASFTVPGKGGVAAAVENDPFQPDRLGREQRHLRYVDKSGLILKEPSSSLSPESSSSESEAIVTEVQAPIANDADATDSVATIEDIIPGVNEASIKHLENEVTEYDSLPVAHARLAKDADQSNEDERGSNEVSHHFFTTNLGSLVLTVSLSVTMIGVFVFVLLRESRRQAAVKAHNLRQQLASQPEQNHRNKEPQPATKST